MACACKAAKKIEAKRQIFLQKSGNKNMSFYMRLVFDGILQILGKIVIVFLFVILTPIIIISLTVSYLLTGKLKIVMPTKMINVLKRIEENE